jgi:DNA-binding PadR family transcriptional regulator
MPWPFWQLFRRGVRARRGDVRAAILALLAEEARNGYQIMRELEQRSRGAWRPSPGSVYPALQQLEDEGLVRAEPESSGGGRVFRLTDKGRKYVDEHADEMSAPWEAAGPAGEENYFGVFGVMTQIRHIASAAMQIAQGGQPRHVKEAHRILAEARRQLYGLLASDEPPEDDE